jgi:hypothetical protein
VGVFHRASEGTVPRSDYGLFGTVSCRDLPSMRRQSLASASAQAGQPAFRGTPPDPEGDLGSVSHCRRASITEASPPHRRVAETAPCRSSRAGSEFRWM